MNVPVDSEDTRRAAVIADPALRRALEGLLRRKVPASDVEDLVQATLADALASNTAPEDPTELRRWVHGIARHKAMDLYAKNRRELPADFADDDVPAESGHESARDLLRWAKRELPTGEHGDRTLEWMLREGAGEKLEHIAHDEDVPAPRVRQRISRLRRHFRERWAMELAIAGTIALAVLGVFVGRKIFAPEPVISREIVPVPGPVTPEENGRAVRRAALEDCRGSRFRECIDGLDRARALDPAGDTTEEVRAARKIASDGLATPAPSAAPSSEPAPSSSSAPLPAPKEPSKEAPHKAAPVSTETPTLSAPARKPPAKKPSKVQSLESFDSMK